MRDRFGTLELLHKEVMNMSNEQKRHCRIGKVTRKYVVPSGVIPGGVILPAINDYFTWNPAQAGGYVPTTSSADVPLAQYSQRRLKAVC
jgi:hypothetical protein